MSNLTKLRKKISIEYEKILLAFHEAAHAIIGLHHCLFIDSISMYNKKYIHGETFYIDYQSNDDKYALKIIQFFYAGLASESYHYYLSTGNSKLPFFLKRPSSFDLTQISKIIAKSNLNKKTSRTNYKKKIYKKTYKLVQHYWDDISLLSHFLLRHKHTKYDRLKKILLEKSKNKKIWKNKFLIIEKIRGNDFQLTPELLGYSDA